MKNSGTSTIETGFTTPRRLSRATGFVVAALLALVPALDSEARSGAFDLEKSDSEHIRIFDWSG